MATVWMVNPKRKKRRAKARVRRNPTRRRARAVMAGARKRVRRRIRRNPVAHTRRHHSFKMAHRKHRRRIRRNPRGMVKGFVGETLIPSLVGAGGALGMNIALGYITPMLPTSLQSGMLNTGVKLVGAVGMGFAAGKVMGRKVGEQVAVGAVTVVLYQAIKSMLATAAPSLPGLSGLEYYSAGMNAGTAPLRAGFSGYSALPPPMPRGMGVSAKTGAGMAEYVPG